jgi:SAM-dependent methyltransferase
MRPEQVAANRAARTVPAVALAHLQAWPADVRDTCGNVFGLSLRQFAPQIPADARVLEIGCAEFNWLKPAQATWPEMTFTGIDWRDTRKIKDRATRIQGDVMTHDVPEASFDWIVSVSAIEHIGLGHYTADPPREDGDSVAMANAYRWLTPGGWMYADVPWNVGAAYEVHGTSHRIYDDATIASRLVQGFDWTVRWTGLASLGGHRVTDPTRLQGGEQFYYRSMWLQKGA